MNPTDSASWSIRGFSNTTGLTQVISPIGSTGEVYIGARLATSMATPDNIGDTPILSIDAGEISKIPDPSGLTGNPLAGLPTPKGGKVLAGIYTAAGVSLNRLYIGGTITGDVKITGSVEDFYAGNIWTGMQVVSMLPGGTNTVGFFDDPHIQEGVTFNDAGPPTGAVLASLVRNFEVNGDLEQLDVSGACGTDATVAVSGDKGPDTPDLNTGFALYVGGHLGSIDCRNSIVGTIHVVNPKSNPRKGFSQTKVAMPGDAIPTSNLGNESFFEGNAGDFGAPEGVPSLFDTILKGLFGNGSYLQPQFLGTPYDASTGFNTAVVDGVLGATSDPNGGANDYTDWYAVPLLAGQSIAVTLQTPDLSLNPTLAAYIADNFAGETATTIQTQLQEALTDLRVGVYSPDVVKLTSASSGSGTNGAAGISPLGMVASTYTNNSQEPDTDSFKFTAQEPGTYYFVVGVDGDINFNGTVDAADAVITENNEPDFRDLGFVPYELSLTGVGNLGVGAVEAGQSIATTFPQEPGQTADTTFIRVDAGDLGAVTVPSSETLSGTGTTMTVTEGGGPAGAFGQVVDSGGNEFYVNNGNLRTIDAEGFGISESGTVASAPTLIRSPIEIDVPNGSVGLLRTTNPDDGMFFNAENEPVSDVQPAPDIPVVGGDYQMIDAAGNLSANVKAARSIGVVRAASVSADTFPGSFQINATGKPEGGVIDLIDVTGDFGTSQDGGPAILDGPGGNVRYLSVGGTIFRDFFFGNPTGESYFTYPAGQSVNLIDDSGTPYTITPVQQKTVFDQTTGTSVTGDPGGTISIITYPVRDSGGIILAGLIATDTMEPNSTAVLTETSGVTITATGSGNNASVDVGDVFVEGDGTTTAFDPYDKSNFTSSGNTLTATFNGNAPVSVWDLSASQPQNNNVVPLPPPTTVGNAGFSSITNSTSGEMPNVEADSLGTFTAQTIGLARSDTGGNFVGDYNLRTETFPFNQQRNLIAITGDAQSIEARSGLGNILVGSVGTGHTLGTLEADTANQFAQNSSQTFPGIDAPVFAEGPTQDITIVNGVYSAVPQGNILSVDVGQGLLSGGTGDHPASGIFATNYIGSVVNQGAGSDIHGPIEASGNAFGLETTSFTVDPTTLTTTATSVAGSGTLIRSVDLTDGAILGGSVQTAARLTDVLPIATMRIDAGTIDVQTGQPVDSITSVSSVGRDAGYLETVIEADRVGSVTTSGGFGIVDSRLGQTTESTIATLSADGYGIRNSTFNGGATAESISAVGNGSLVDVRRLNPAARQSETGATYDPFSGEQLNAGNDLDLTFEISQTRPKRVGESESGVIAGDLFTGEQSLNSLTAWRLGEPSNPQSLNRISFGLSIGSIKVADSMYYTRITTGGIPQLSIKGQMFDSSLTVAGAIGNVSIDDFKANSSIIAQGPDGTIGNVDIGNIFGGTLNSSVSIGDLIVNGNFTSPDVYVAGPFNTIDVGGSVASGSSIDVVGTLSDFVVKKNFAGLLQAKAIKHKAILGHNTGKIIIT